MAKTMKCKTCGETISKKAKTCPHCGHSYEKKGMSFSTAVVLIFVAAAIASTFSEKSKKTDVTHERKVVQHKSHVDKRLVAAVKKLEKKMKSEKKIKGVYTKINDGAVYVYAGVFDNGKHRDGLAQYICLLANEAGVTDKKYGAPVFVKINDATAMISSKKNIILGEAVCEQQ